MLAAKEAREALVRKRKEEQRMELRSLEEIIRKAISQNENCVIAKELYEDTIRALHKEGYKVKFKAGFLFINPHWEISW